MPERLRTEGIVLAPALPAVGLLVYWAAEGGGYAATTWELSALAVLGLLAATLAGIGLGRLRVGRPAAIALAAFAGYVGWSYLSILWAVSPGDALEGANRTLLFLLLFALFAVLPWRAWTALAALSAFALALGTIAVVTLVRIGSADQVAGLFSHGRLVSPIGYENGAAALFLVGTILPVALAARRELPLILRGLLLAGATAALQAAILCESRGWLFALPVVLVVAVALLPGRVRLLLWAAPPVAGALVALPALLDVFERFDRVDRIESLAAAQGALADPAHHAAAVALPICAVVLVVGLALAWADRRVTASAAVTRAANRAAVGLALAGALAGAAVGFVATDGRPDRTIADYWERSNGYQPAAPGSSRFARLGSNRPDFWRVALDAAVAHPVQGLGQDNWSDYYLRNRRSDDEPRWTHSLELRLLAHTGIVGFLLFAGFLGGALTAALRGRRRAGPMASAAATTALLPLVVWVVHGSIDWFWEIPALSGPAFAFLGLATAVMSREAAFVPISTERFGRPLPTLAMGLAGIVAALVLAFPYLAEREVAEATRTWRADPGNALTRLERAADLNPLSARAHLTAGVIATELGRNGTARRHLSAAIAREPENWFGRFVRGLAGSADGARGAARADYERAQALDPREPLVAAALARVDGRRPLTAEEAFGAVLRNVQRLTGQPVSDGHS